MQAGYAGQQISDTVGLSVEIVGRYSPLQDPKTAAQTVLRDYRERRIVKN